MRRLLAVALSGTVAAALLTGCGGRPAGVDGDLTDDWSAPPAPTSLSPQAGSCHPTAEPTSYLESYSPRDCASPHRSETLHVGSFTGAPANAASPPAAASPARRAALRDCDARATRFVGADWRGGSLGVRVVTPSPPGWTGGSRWYRCDVFEKPPLDSPLGISGNDLSVERVGSLRNALAKPSPLAYRCFNQGPGQTLAPVSCDRAHRLEYAGVWTAPDGLSENPDRGSDELYRHCLAVVARYVKIPRSMDLRRYISVAWRPPSPDAWERGDRGIRCFLWAGFDLKRSARGAGPGVLAGP